ncbi:MAG TPA: hypothetical protein VGN72_21915 [Tepidisphaeraceae bacterium]|jgi:hypothetical protein|nr:hypothetical protein [Tepidisphaeraceae bacterium]
MSRSVPPDIIAFDRFWRAGHPMRPRTSKRRRRCMFMLLLLLAGSIGTYAYVTNSNRVRAMAERYLSQLLGGPVQVRRATLSMFEGLRLDDVQVHLAGERLDQPPIFSADTFVVRYSLRQLLAGRIEATQIIVRRPHVQLTQDVDSLIRSYRKVVRDDADGQGDGDGGPPAPKVPRRPMVLPEISLRDARIDYTEQHPDGTTSFGTLALEGQFTASPGSDRYGFSLQSRGMSDRMGPYIEGLIYPAVGRVTAQLRNFELDSDLRLMLPTAVRQWWERHELAGKLDITELSYVLPRGDSDARFTVNTELQGVTLTVPPGELQGSDESRRVASVRDTLDTMAAVYAAAGYAKSGELEAIDAQFRSGPLRLENMAGVFTFTESGIAVTGVQGDVEGNRIHIDGKIDGYPGRDGAAEPTAKLRITSGQKPLTLPAAPRYTNALPRAVREIYDQLRPQGSCTLAVTIGRPTPGANINIDGAIDVLDGNFTFLRFPYPVRKATGQIAFKPADAEAPERLELSLSGYGLPNGPNAETVVNVSGLMGPLGNDAGVAIRIASDKVYSEAALTEAFPADVQRTFKLFDADGQGELPKLRGSFTCDVNRAIGPNQPWLLFTHVKVESATAKMAAFPYPLEDLAMELKIGQNQVQIINANMQRNDASLRVDGRVSWAPSPRELPGMPRPREPERSTTVTELVVKADNLPIDRDLLMALPESNRKWITEMGIAGRLDVSGTVSSRPREEAASSLASTLADAVDYDLTATMRNGTVWPKVGSFVIGSVGGQIKLQPNRIELAKVTGERAGATVSANGAIDFINGTSRADLTVSAKNLTLDAPLYALVPDAARKAWDQVRPKGTLDVDIILNGPLGGSDDREQVATVAPVGDAAGKASVANSIAAKRSDTMPKIVLRPRSLSIYPRAFPYALDHVTGRVVIDNGKTTLHQVTGRHGEGTLSVWGSTQTVADHDVWDLTLFARNVLADEELIGAMPMALADSLRSMELSGRIGWYVPRFLHTAPKGSTDPGKGNIDLSGRISLAGANVNVGVPLTDVFGDVSGQAIVTDGKLKSIRGTIQFDKLLLAERPVRNVYATIDRPAGSHETRLSKISGELAGGNLVGDVLLIARPGEPERFTLDMILRDADAATIAMEGFDDLKGRLSASLGLEGEFDNAASRRGRGDVLVTGKDMYNLPLVVGLLQITNLALPVNTPVTEATARYNVEGQRINFEHVALRSNTVLMEGEGHLDFETKKVAMTFRTDNPNAPKIPFLSDLWRNAQQELFKIEVRGTVQDPKVSNAALNTVTTTVDEVFNGKEK